MQSSNKTPKWFSWNNNIQFATHFARARNRTRKKKWIFGWSGYLNSDQNVFFSSACIFLTHRSRSLFFLLLRVFSSPHCHVLFDGVVGSSLSLSCFIFFCLFSAIVGGCCIWICALCKSCRFCELVATVDLSLHDCGGFSFYCTWCAPVFSIPLPCPSIGSRCIFLLHIFAVHTHCEYTFTYVHHLIQKSNQSK